MHEFGDCKREFFETLLDLEHAIPSHDTFGRVFAAISPETLMQALSEWMRQRAANAARSKPPAGKPGAHSDGKDALAFWYGDDVPAAQSGGELALAGPS